RSRSPPCSNKRDNRERRRESFPDQRFDQRRDRDRNNGQRHEQRGRGQFFQNGADRFVPPAVCANCLGRHERRACIGGSTWDGGRTRCTRNDRGRLINPSGAELCSDFQQPEGCSSRGHDEKHECA
ncbi:hypothetical protein C8R43DRAFT_851736, partial [Mycena crocata]